MKCSLKRCGKELLPRLRREKRSPCFELFGTPPGWVSIWDVAIVPNWQGRDIGSEIMKRALAMIREASPGAAVFLFTSKLGFYEHLGLREEKVTMIGV